jgi:transglutaminase-like putative cysteine protease
VDKEEQWAMLDQLRWKVPYIDFLGQEPFAYYSEVLKTVCPDTHRSLTPLEAARQLRQYVYDHFKYIKGITSVETTLNEVWELKAGVCQDFAHICWSSLRQIQIPHAMSADTSVPTATGCGAKALPMPG